jgi:4-amino-4-deoxy-L-arabinose transferase-like glycosyltransferase
VAVAVAPGRDAMVPVTPPEGVVDERPSSHRRWPTPHGWIVSAIGALTALLYVWNLDAVGDANAFYAAAVKSASVSWKAWFFGSLDPGSFITVDKPPMGLWAEGLSARIFGYSTASMLLPEVLLSIGSVLILHHLVRRWKGDVAAHLAAIAFAVTPIATAMARSNNPDATLTFLGLAAAWGIWNAVESGRTRPLLIAAAVTGVAFNVKMLQALIIVPAFAVVYLVAGPPRLARRFGQLLMAGGVLAVSAGWYPLLVTLWPAASRPYIGSTTDNSIVSLMLGYNGLDRVFGGTGGNSPGGAIGFGGQPGLTRMFGTEVAGQVAWLLPLAGAGLLAGLWVSLWRRRRTDRELAGWLLWGGWAVLCLGVFSFSEGIFHPYYTVQVAPAIAALAGAGAVTLFDLGRRRGGAKTVLRLAFPAAVIVTAGVAIGILRNTPNYHAALRTVIVIGGTAACALVVIAAVARSRVLAIGAAAVAAVTLLTGPVAYSITTVAQPVVGTLISAGPAVRGPGLGGLVFGGRAPARIPETPSEKQLIAFLVAHRGRATYIVAGVGASSTERLIIATGLPVMTIGGFNGSDPTPTLAQFQHMVATGQVRYLMAAGRVGIGRSADDTVVGWAQQHGTIVQAGTTSLYDLASVAGSEGNG